MSLWLKQSTAVTIKFGPFVDATDGVTAETGLTISQADIRLSKNGGNIAQSNNAAGATHDELGYYDVPLDTTDTNTLGTLRVAVSESGALPVWQDFLVVAANVYDSIIGGGDLLQVDSTQLLGTAYATPTVAGVQEVDLTHVAGSTTDVSTIPASVAAILVDTGTTLDGRLPAALVSGRMDSSVGAMAANVLTATAINADAITAAKLAADVAQELRPRKV